MATPQRVLAAAGPVDLDLNRPTPLLSADRGPLLTGVRNKEQRRLSDCFPVAALYDEVVGEAAANLDAALWTLAY